jgi:acyl-CoA thioesterase-1
MKHTNKRIRAISIVILALFLSLTVLGYSIMSAANDPAGKLARVACIGDSITEITGYPEDLQMLLGNGSVVGNFGVSCATVNFNTSKPYYFEPTFKTARASLPTTVIILLGTNDARTDIYDRINRFVSDYERLVGKIQALSSKPQIFLVKPPPIFENYLNLSSTDFVEGVLPRIEQVAGNLSLPLIDVYTPLVNHPEYFVDGVHLNSEGAQIVANIIYRGIENSK